MLKLSFEGITSLSIKPIRIITMLGIVIFIISAAMIVFSRLASMISSLWCVGGLMLLSIGIVGEYIGRIYLETKRRPRFTIEKKLFME
ncbi:MAG: hypothetical protein LBU84_12335 [Prevotella sp.]|jgi:hypothetical protein|nr:hypothetical protein [Prevotella sp.]